MNNLTSEEITLIEQKYRDKVEDILLKQKFDNLEKCIPWKSVKNNNKTNKLKKKQDTYIHKKDPYKFLAIPNNMKEIIKQLCHKNEISLQKLAVRTNLPLSLINSYMNDNYPIDNYYLDIILKYFEFDLVDLVDYVDKNNSKLNNIEN